MCDEKFDEKGHAIFAEIHWWGHRVPNIIMGVPKPEFPPQTRIFGFLQTWIAAVSSLTSQQLKTVENRVAEFPRILETYQRRLPGNVASRVECPFFSLFFSLCALRRAWRSAAKGSTIPSPDQINRISTWPNAPSTTNQIPSRKPSRCDGSIVFLSSWSRTCRSLIPRLTSIGS